MRYASRTALPLWPKRRTRTRRPTAYDAQWLAILDTEVEGKVSIGDCYSYKLQNGGWDITDWNNMDLLPTPAFKLLKSADVTMVGISFTNEGGVVLLPY